MLTFPLLSLSSFSLRSLLFRHFGDTHDADFCVFFLHGQRSVVEPGPTPTPWSIFFYAFCFSPTGGELPRLKICFPQYFGPGVLACATGGGGRSEAGHCFHLLFSKRFSCSPKDSFSPESGGRVKSSTAMDDMSKQGTIRL